MPLTPWTGPGNHARVIYHRQLDSATCEWVRESKSEKTKIKYLAGRGFAGSVVALDDGSEPRPL